MKVSFFKSVKNTAPTVSKDVVHFLDRIREGKSRNTVEAIRHENDEDEQKRLKIQLPVVCFNGHFKSRSIKGMVKSSGLMVLDFDDFSNFDQSKAFKDKVKKDKHIFAAWISPRLGVKALYKIVQVTTDQEFKNCFSQVKENYPNLDNSGKDISRACFESYDPNIYVNLEAETFIPQVREEFADYKEIAQTTNVPLRDQDVIANRLVKWFEKHFNPNERNNSIYILASAFNSFGVAQETAFNYCMTFAKSTAPQKEVMKVIKSAYKRTAEFGSKSFEDKVRKKKLKHAVVSGKKLKQIADEFDDIPEDGLKKEYDIVKESTDLEQFWEYNFEGKLKINPYLFKIYLENQNYYKYYPVGQSDAFVFITKEDNFLNDTNEFQIKDHVTNQLLEKNEVDVFNLVAEKTKLFQSNYLSMINTADVETKKDGKDYAMLYYRNIALKVLKDKVEEIEYEDLGGFVWEDQVIDRDYQKEDHHNSMFRTFLWHVSDKSKERYNTLKSVIGYLLHSYKTSANNKAIILNDEVISDNPNGGSGKGIFTSAVSQMKKVSTIDGKTFDFNKSFAYQTVPTDCQVLAFDDVKKNFNFETLFSVITEGITIEYKGKDAVKLPIQDSPKVLISTNYTIKAEGGSFERRMFEVEFSSYYGAHHSPLDEFGMLLFDEWEDHEWRMFDEYMINCLQYYLKNGLVESELKNLDLRKLINKTSREFIEWMSEKDFIKNQRIDYKMWFNQFKTSYQDFEKWLTQRAFNDWLRSYFEFKNIKYKSVSTNGVRMYEIESSPQSSNDEPEDESENDDKDIWDVIEKENGIS